MRKSRTEISFEFVHLDLTIRNLSNFTGSYGGTYLEGSGSSEQKIRMCGIFENQIWKSVSW